MSTTRTIPAYDIIPGDVIAFYGEKVVRDVTAPQAALDFLAGARPSVTLHLECLETGERTQEVVKADKHLTVVQPAD